jgi:hypothetical protein
VVKKAEVRRTTKDGSSWDINEGKPDLAVIVRNLAEKDSSPFQTEEKADTFTAEFNVPANIKVDAGQDFEFEVIDRDAAVNDTIGKIQKKMTPDLLKEGTLKLENFEQVVVLELELKRLEK